jgi:hypothetical protein
MNIKYIIKDEHGEVMRIVHRKEEANSICKLREGWNFIKVQYKRKLDLSQFQEALL